MHLDGEFASVPLERVELPDFGPVTVVGLAVFDALAYVEGAESLWVDVEAVVGEDLVGARLHRQMGRPKQGILRQELALDLRAPNMPAALAALLPRDKARLAEPLVPQQQVVDRAVAKVE